MTARTCSIEGCERPLRARGWCATHWYRWRHNGDPNAVQVHVDESVRFWASIDRGSVPPAQCPDLSPCWEWTGPKKATGYGRMRVDGRYAPAHRYAYELLVGPIPEGLEIDHLCWNRSCVNPDHLEPVTRSENVRRSRRVAFASGGVRS